MRNHPFTISLLAFIFGCSALASAQSAHRAASADPDVKELASYTLTMDTMNRIDRAMHAMAASIRKDPKLADAAGDDDKDDDANTLSDMERKIAGIPVMASALKQEGVTPRDYAKFSMALMQGSMTLAGQRMASKAGKPFAIPEGINPANVTFVQEHEAEITKMQESYSELSIR